MLKVHFRGLGDVTILCLQGRVVIGETSALFNAVLSQSEVSTVVLDLARVSRIDAHGIGVLLELRHYALAKGIEFRLMKVTKLVQHVLEITCLNSVFRISSEAEVLSLISSVQPHETFQPLCA